MNDQPLPLPLAGIFLLQEHLHFLIEFLINGRVTLVEFLAGGQREVWNFRCYRGGNGIKIGEAE